MVKCRPASNGFGRLIEILGDEKTLLFLEHYAGRPTYIPLKLHPDMQLVKLVGLESAQALSDVYGGEHMPVPLVKEWRALQYKAQGMSARTIAGKLGVGVNTVFNMFGRHREKEPDLFD